MGALTYPSLEHVAMQARPYPDRLLKGCETGLVLFAAAFLGHNDAIHFAMAGMRTMCVDVDAERLAEMHELYPSDWTFCVADAFRVIERYPESLGILRDAPFDVVSADTFTGAATRRALDSLDLLCDLSRRLVTVTYTDGEAYEVPDGWRSSLYGRATGVHWLVLERA